MKKLIVTLLLGIVLTSCSFKTTVGTDNSFKILDQESSTIVTMACSNGTPMVVLTNQHHSAGFPVTVISNENNEVIDCRNTVGESND